LEARAIGLVTVYAAVMPPTASASELMDFHVAQLDRVLNAIEVKVDRLRAKKVAVPA